MMKNTLQRNPNKKKLLVVGLLLLVLLVAGLFAILRTKGSLVHDKKGSVASLSSTIMFGSDPQQTGFYPAEHTLNPTNVSHLVLYWMAHDPGASSVMTGSPVVVNGIAYALGAYTVNAFDARTGTTLWAARIESMAVVDLRVIHGIVYVQTDRLWAFDARTGKFLWRTSEPSGWIIPGIIYSNSGKLYAVDTKIKIPQWMAHLQGIVFAVADGIIYVSQDQPTRLSAFDLETGFPRWTFTVQGSYIQSSVLADGIIYAGSDYPDTKLYALDAKTGAILWTYTTAGSFYSKVGPLAFANGVVYIGADYPPRGRIYALNAKTGTVLWDFSSPTENPIWSVVVANGVIYTTLDYPGTLYALDAKTGASLWTISDSLPPNSVCGSLHDTPVVANGVLYIGPCALHLPNKATSLPFEIEAAVFAAAKRPIK